MRGSRRSWGRLLGRGDGFQGWNRKRAAGAPLDADAKGRLADVQLGDPLLGDEVYQV
jgi:hypothetical protein